MSDENFLIKERKRKLEELRKLGVDPYPHNFTPTHQSLDLQEKYKGLKNEEHSDDEVTVAGRLTIVRKMGKAAFADLLDESGKIQLYLRKDTLNDQFNVFKLTEAGDWVGVKGKLFRTKMGELSIEVNDFQLICKSLLPLPEKYHGLKDTEIRYRQRYMDLTMNPEVRKVFKLRTELIKSIKETFEEHDFMEVETPTLQPVYGGANAKPFTTHHNTLDMKLYLRISNELYLKRLIVGGFHRVFEFVKDFRNEGIDRTHNPEFTMVEWYQAYGDYNTGMELFEKIWENAAKKLFNSTKIKYQDKEIELKTPWPRKKMADLIKEHAKIDVIDMKREDLLDFCDKNNVDYDSSSWGMLVQAIFEHYCEEHLIQPTFVIDHPIETTPLCKPMRDGDKRFVERFEPYVMGWEVGNGYTELNDPVLQRELLEDQEKRKDSGEDETHPMDEDFVTAIEFGMPPTSGVGLGVDRMVMLFTNQHTIRDVVFFPLLKDKDNKDK